MAVNNQIEHAIAHGAAALRCGLPEGGAAKLADYVALLAKWNAKINLTAIRDPAQMVTHHILDCLAIVPEVAALSYAARGPGTGIDAKAYVASRRNRGAMNSDTAHEAVPSGQAQSIRVADVGTGAGLPGLVLAFAQPQMQVTCIDTVEKKIAFVQQAIGLLGLSNAKALAARVETVQERFDVVTCRAFAALADVVTLAGHMLKPEGLLLAMKGPRVEREAAALPAGWLYLGAMDLKVPGLNEARHLAVIRKI
jgi:16S rRNA (guanine527-N7)-methyltransferase